MTATRMRPTFVLNLPLPADEAARRGRFAPRPDLWTFIIFVYFVMAFLMLFGASFGYVQWTMDDWPWGLLALPIGAVVIASLHVASRIGQRLGDEQMRQLRSRPDDLIQRSPDSPETVGGWSVCCPCPPMFPSNPNRSANV